MNKENEIIIYTDGGARGNPGLAGAGAWLETLNEERSWFLGDNKTNNEAEYEALILGLKELQKVVGKKKAKDLRVLCRLDSELVVKQLNHEYKLKDERIQKYFIKIWNLMLDFNNVNFEHIRREKNKIADRLANEAMDKNERQNKLF